MAFQKAVRKKVWIKAALTGPTHAGKTLGGLLMLRGLVGDSGRIAVLDTEHGRASHYAGRTDLGVDFDFDADDLTTFEVEHYTRGISEAVAGGYNGLLIDSFSHAWMGEGGILDLVDKSGANSFSSGWRKATPKQRALVDAILRSPIHLVCTMRSQMAYEVVENDRGKKEPKKIGLKPMQRSDVEYEFAVVLDLEKDKHLATVTKDVTGVFPTDPFLISREHGEALAAWIDQGEGSMPVGPVAEADLLRGELPDCVTGEDLKAWWNRAGRLPERDALKGSFAAHVKGLGYRPVDAATEGKLVPLADEAAA